MEPFVTACIDCGLGMHSWVVPALCWRCDRRTKQVVEPLLDDLRRRLAEVELRPAALDDPAKEGGGGGGDD